MTTVQRFPPQHAKINNVLDKNDPQARIEWCPWCGNTAWVELAGTVTIGQETYERGCAPCRGCTLGQKVYTANMQRGRYFEAYTEEDVDPDAIPVNPKAQTVRRNVQRPRLALVEPPRRDTPIAELAPPPPVGDTGDTEPYEGDEPEPPRADG